MSVSPVTDLTSFGWHPSMKILPGQAFSTQGLSATIEPNEQVYSPYVYDPAISSASYSSSTPYLPTRSSSYLPTYTNDYWMPERFEDESDSDTVSLLSSRSQSCVSLSSSGDTIPQSPWSSNSSIGSGYFTSSPSQNTSPHVDTGYSSSGLPTISDSNLSEYAFPCDHNANPNVTFDTYLGGASATPSHSPTPSRSSSRFGNHARSALRKGLSLFQSNKSSATSAYDSRSPYSTIATSPARSSRLFPHFNKQKSKSTPAWSSMPDVSQSAVSGKSWFSRSATSLFHRRGSPSFSGSGGESLSNDIAQSDTLNFDGCRQMWNGVDLEDQRIRQAELANDGVYSTAKSLGLTTRDSQTDFVSDQRAALSHFSRL